MLRLLLSPLFLFLACTFLVPWVHAAPLTLKLGHIAEPDNNYGQGATYFAKLVAERSKGEINIEIYPSSQLGDQRELVENLSVGTVDMTLTSTAVLGNFAPEVAVFDLPFLFRDVQHAYKVLDTVGMELCKKAEARGMVTLAIWENGFRHMTNNIRPISEPGDMRGLKFRVMEQPVYIALMRSLGAKPVPMGMSDLREALVKGLVTGQDNSLSHIVTKRFFEVQQYLSLTGHTYAPEPLLISTSVWERLTPQQQQLLRTAAEDARDWQRALSRKLENECLETVKKSGTCAVNNNVDKAAFAKATRAVWNDIYVKRFGEDTINRILAIQ